MGRSQRQKGKRGEREACELLRSLGYEAQRSIQYCGRGEDSADIQHSIPGVRIEAKYGYDELNLGSEAVAEWMTKLKSELRDGERPLILWRKTRQKWTALVEVGGVLMQTADVAGAIRLAATPQHPGPPS